MIPGSPVLDSFLFAVVTLLPLVNPIAFAPVFQRFTAQCTQAERIWLAKKVAVYSAILMVAVLFLGTPLLRLFGVSLPFLQIAGGILVAHAGWEALRTEPDNNLNDERHSSLDYQSLAFFPLTLPLTVGPGAIAATLGIAATNGGAFLHPSLSEWLNYMGTVLGMLFCAAFICVCYAYAGKIFEKLGRTGTAVVSNLSALIILAIGLQIMWHGVQALLKTIQ
ncbi:MAG: hypothetical protein A3J38_10685 [Gammaproteobacteria bacterium RIFCSPHIGHO2_12_FULL_45_9]|nr:MAG: hypothetical protein A3J38_10685 [Gammaproteobacteria bacterium RIFCSPHIGHO2_12_FULL_45_9]